MFLYVNHQPLFGATFSSEFLQTLFSYGSFAASSLIYKLFSICAWGGTLIYALRVVIGFAGSADLDASIDSTEHHFSDDAFNFLSLNTLVGFLMMFGWGGLVAYKQFDLSQALSIFIALLSGVFFVIVTQWIFKSAKKLTSSGTVFDVQKVVGKQGKVYQEIQPGKRGVVQVILDDFIRELDAISIDQSEIPSFKPVEIIKAIDSKTVIVKQID